MKDAAAASIWGARAGNGVIVITTKQGKSKNPSIAVSSVIGLSLKPSYGNISQISSSDYIQLEKWLFEKGHYTGDEFFDSMNNGHPPFTPVVELLRKQRDNLLTEEEVERQIALLKDNDVRKDILRDLYQIGFKQQYGVQIGQQTDRARYIFSAGYDHNRNLLVAQGDRRLNLRVNLETQIVKNIWLNNSLSYTNSSQFNGINGGFGLKGYAPFATGGGKGVYPYAQLRNEDGSPAYLYLDNNESYVTAQRAKGLDWSYSPIEEIRKIKASNDVGDLLLNTGIKFAPIANLNVLLQYQFEDQSSLMSSIRTADSYYTRAYTNSFAQLGANGKLTFPVPQGGIWDTNTVRRRVHQGRVQGEYSKLWTTGHDLSLMAGWEIRSNVNKTAMDRLYGYSEEFYGINPTVDYMTEYVLYNNSFMRQRIPTGKGIGKYTDNFLSMFFNGSYSFNNRYIATFSLRKDEANQAYWKGEETVIHAPEIEVCYEAWIRSIDDLKSNEELLDDQEEVFDEDNEEDGFFQVEISAKLQAANGSSFSALDIMYQMEHQVSNKELGDHIFFEGFQRAQDYNEALPLYHMVCGS